MHTEPQDRIASASERGGGGERESCSFIYIKLVPVFWNLHCGESSFPVTRVESRSFIPARLCYVV